MKREREIRGYGRERRIGRGKEEERENGERGREVLLATEILRRKREMGRERENSPRNGNLFPSRERSRARAREKKRRRSGRRRELGRDAAL